MPMVYPQYGPGFGSAAMDGLQLLGSASPSSGFKPNPRRLTENQPLDYPLPATPPVEEPYGVPNRWKPGRPAAPVQGLMTALPGPKLEQ